LLAYSVFKNLGITTSAQNDIYLILILDYLKTIIAFFIITHNLGTMAIGAVDL